MIASGTRSLLIALALTSPVLAAEASAVSVVLSTETSDPAFPANSLDATLDFDVTGTTLVITLSNDSAMAIQAIDFNTQPSVTGLALSSGPSKWKLETPANKGKPTDTGTFGVFDYVVWVKGRKATKEDTTLGMAPSFRSTSRPLVRSALGTSPVERVRRREARAPPVSPHSSPMARIESSAPFTPRSRVPSC